MNIISEKLSSFQTYKGLCPTHGEVDFSQVMNLPAFCTKCLADDHKREQERHDKQRHHERRLASMAANGINTYAKGFDAWEYDATQQARQEKILKNLTGYAINFKLHNPNLLLIGGTGSGKTLLSNALARAVYKRQFDKGAHYPAKFVRSSAIVRAYKEHWNDRSKPTEQMIINSLAQFDLLVIDDLGDNDTTGNPDADRGRLGELINARYQRKPTVITTNLNVEQCKQFMGDRAWDRFQEKLIIVRCDWASYRQKAGVAQVDEW